MGLDVSLGVQLLALLGLLLLSGFFSLAETAMMASNRYRLRHLSMNGNAGARKALVLLEHTDKFLGVVLLGNNLLNSAAATLVGVIAIELFGDEKWALGAGTLAVTFAILVCAEITPKVLGATYADRLAMSSAYILTPLLRLFYPVVWFVNLFVSVLLKPFRLPGRLEQIEGRLSAEELRTLVLESAHFIPPKHRTILSNLFELDAVTVEDVMTPRGAIEILDLALPWNEVLAQLATSHHSRLPVCHESLDHLLGVLPIRRLITEVERGELDEPVLRAQLTAPYYIPAGTPVFLQLGFFQDTRQQLGFVIDEYGEILGMLTLEDIVEEIVGQFTSSLSERCAHLAWDEEGCAVVDGVRPLREINRLLGLDFPMDGPKTLNGLILEYFQDIPEPGVSFKIAGVQIEIVQTQDRSVRTAKLFKP